MGLPVCVITHVVAAGFWLLLKRRLLRRHPSKVSHVAA
jgi:hypothetical protein